jgi:GT2 family glycosyltransferase
VQPRVTAILVARNGAEYLDRTLAALTSQTHKPDALIAVDAASKDASAATLTAAIPTLFVTSTSRGGFGANVAHALRSAPPAEGNDDWLWLLTHDSAPHPGALASLLAAVEIAPSVAIAGPKLMRWDEDDVIARYGESITQLGASVLLVENELDQAQYDRQSDLLGVAASGMLVRRSVWTALGGFDPGLPSVDAALDFSIRARLAGHRVVGVPQARVASAGGPELFGRTTISASATARLSRRAQLHRRMVYAPGAALLVHWLSLVPIALLRCILQLIRKQPGLVGAELAAAFATAFSGRVAPARKNLRRTRRVRWSAIAPLRVSSAQARERRASRPVAGDGDFGPQQRTRASFFAGGGAAMVVLTAVIGVIAFGPLLGASGVQGGGLLPLSSTVAQLWVNVGYGWHQVAGGVAGPSDPFTAVLAVLGSLTFWSPSFSVVLLYLAALPLAALAAWWCATRLSSKAWPPAIAALLWAFAPSFLASLDAGHLGAVIAHILLPWLVFAALAAARSWSASAAAAILFAVVAASAPSIVPALVVLLVVWIAARPTGVLRIVGIVIPAAVLFAPLVVAQVQRGTPLAILADPGPPTAVPAAAPLQLALGAPDATLAGWAKVQLFELASLPGPLVFAILLVPFLLLALAGAFLPGSRRSIPSLVIAAFGFATAVAATHLTFTTVGTSAVTVWPGAGLSLLWLGLIGAAVVALDALGRAAAVPALVVALASTLAVAPLLIQPLAGGAKIAASTGALLPAYVNAEASTKPGLGTLVVTPLSNGGLGVSVQRGTGASMDDQSTYASTLGTLTAAQKSSATLAANLASRSGLDMPPALQGDRIGFVLLGPATTGGASDVRQRAADALNDDSALTPVGTTPQGVLWRNGDLSKSGLAAVPTVDGTLREWYLWILGAVFLITLLLAIPTRSSRRRASVVRADDEHATLGEDDNV